MLNQAVDELLFDDSGKVKGFRTGEDTATAPLVICDPSYAKDSMLKPSNKVIRAICIMDHPIPETNNVKSAQIIIPARQLDRNNDTYISMVSSDHAICAQGLYVATVATIVETDQPEAEIQPALNLLGGILEMFVTVTQLYDPLENGMKSNLWITKSYDPSSHFEVASQEILDIYQMITGEVLDMNIEADSDEEEF